MLGFKGFNKDFECRDFKYEVGKTYTHEGKIKLCEEGFHACELPHEIFNYYSAGSGNKFAEVEMDNVSEEKSSDDSKRVCSKITVKAEISVFQICRIAVQAFFEKFDFSKKIKSSETNNAGDGGAANAGYKGAANAGDGGAANAGYKGAANAGDGGAANAGDKGAANAGYKGAANAGDYGAANAGDKGAANAGDGGAANAGDKGAANAGNGGAANAGDGGAANAGDYGAANAGDKGAANAGYKGAANAGDYGDANAGDKGAANAGYKGAANAGDYGAANAGDKGAASVGEKGVAICSTAGRVRGGLGSVLVLVNRDDEGNITEYSARKVDGKKIKANTFYQLKNKKFVEVQ